MPSDFDFSQCYRINPTLVEQEVDGDRVVLNPANGKIVTFEQLTAVIWEIMQSQTTFQEILGLIRESFSVEEDQLKSDLVDFWNSLIRDQFIKID